MGVGMLDLSIQSVDKLCNKKDKEDKEKMLLSSDVVVEQKTDGIKVTLLKINSNGNINDWVIAYKGNILYEYEFNYLTLDEIKTQSIGASQFRIVIEHFKEISHKIKDIEIGTEFFIEFLMKKPTLSSNYLEHHNMVLIGYSKSKYEIKNGILKTEPEKFETNLRNQFAYKLGIDVPMILFKGKLQEFKKPLNEIKEYFLSIESKYGGKEEGVVITFSDGLKLKWQQDYQLDKEARNKIKNLYKEDSIEDENIYWKNIRDVAKHINSDLPTNNIIKGLWKISEYLKSYKPYFNHSKKNLINILDDIQLTSKIMYIKKLDGNNNALIIGKFRILTNAHYEMINNALKKYDGVVVALITSKDTKFSKDIRRKMLEKCFGNKISIIENPTGNLGTLLHKSNENINYIVSGSDRIETYKQQLLKNPDIKIEEIKRADSSISASKVIKNINNFEYFKENTPNEISEFYLELKGLYDGYV